MRLEGQTRNTYTILVGKSEISVIVGWRIMLQSILDQMLYEGMS